MTAAEPMVMNHRANSPSAVRRGGRLVECDVRKSQDGVLFCHHGGPAGWILGFFLRFLRWSTIKRLVDPSLLSDVVRAASDQQETFFDLWQRNIALSDLIETCPRGRFWIGVRTCAHVTALHTANAHLRHNAVIVFNLAAPRSLVRRAAKAGAAVVKVFFWQRQLIDELRRQDVGIALSRFALRTAAYRRLVVALDSRWVVDSRYSPRNAK